MKDGLGNLSYHQKQDQKKQQNAEEEGAEYQGATRLNQITLQHPMDQNVYMKGITVKKSNALI